MNPSKIHARISAPKGKTIAPHVRAQSQSLCFVPLLRSGRGGPDQRRSRPRRVFLDRLYQYNRRTKNLSERLPIEGRREGSAPHWPDPRARVTGLEPGDPKWVSKPRYIMDWLVRTRARALLTCAVPNARTRAKIARGEGNSNENVVYYK